ncbi:hypothetical protein AQUCO_73100002v1 [Aquilegia coerulea]|uniref:Uncharacterized protein n=1 Tax=Aquilegia coerulea TaxID=218851 RepID=A0A2G5C0C3_AQUCA|nr:hypothetical protein AQUCO_73100002v1 [Aquilegia coerulea]
MPGEEAGAKLVRLLWFVGAGVITTTSINLWRDYERKSAAAAVAVAAQGSISEIPTNDLGQMVKK